jgi:hypothetical protein
MFSHVDPSSRCDLGAQMDLIPDIIDFFVTLAADSFL